MADGPAENPVEAAPVAAPVPDTADSIETAPSEPEATAGATIGRRLLLKGLGAGLATAGLAPLLAACSSSNNGKITKVPVGAAPAGGTPSISVSKGASLSILMWNHFVPAFDQYFDKYAKDWGNANGVNVRVDHVDIAQLPGRLAAEAAAGKGHDLFAFAAQIQTRRYESRLVDMTPLMEPLIKQYGDVIPIGKATSLINGVWRGVPHFNVLIAPLIRTDLLKENGLNTPQSWDDILKIGRVMKPKGHATGMAISHCNDSNHNWRAVMWSFGASIVHEDGKTLALDTQEMKDFLTWAKQFQAEANSDEVYAWQDVSDNQYLGSGQGVFIHDAISSLRSLQQPNPTLYNNIDILAPLKGPKVQITMPDPQVFAIWNFTPKANVEAATSFLWTYMNNWKQNFIASTGYNMPLFANQLQKPMPVLSEDPKYQVLQDYQGSLLQTYGYPGPQNPAAEDVLAQYILPDMIARLRGNGTVDDALKFGHDQIAPIYAKNYKSVLTPAPNVTAVPR